MNNKMNASELKDFFKVKNLRPANTSFATFIDSYSDDVHAFLLRYCGEAMKCGFIMDEGLANPTNENLEYMTNIITLDFDMSQRFISDKLKKWISTLTLPQATLLSESMYSVLLELRNNGKSDGVLKNAYVKFMCWLYYKFRSTLNNLCGETIPKILYKGSVTTYELYMLEIIARCGCDVVIIDDETQDKVKSEPMFPSRISLTNTRPFPNDFDTKSLKKEVVEKQKLDMMMGPKSSYKLYRNAWLPNPDFEHVLDVDRSDDRDLICNMFVSYSGADDRTRYIKMLYDSYTKLSETRKVIIETGIKTITPADTANLVNVQCKSFNDIIVLITKNINFADAELTKYAKHLMIDIADKIFKETNNILKCENSVKRDLTLLLRYKDMFAMKKSGVLFIFEKQPLNDFDTEALTLLSQMPIDIIIVNPMKFPHVASEGVFTVDYDDKLELEKFPTEKSDMNYSTVAFNARNDLVDMLYTNSELHQDRQYQFAEAVPLKTTYDEIFILWPENVNMRPGFEVTDNKVTVPTIFTKVSGVKGGNKKAYIKSIEKLVTENEYVLYVSNVIPWFNRMPNTARIAQVMTNGKIDVDKVRNHQEFKFDFLRDETIAFMVDKLNVLLQSGIVTGMGKNGSENIMMQVFFNLPTDVISLMQKFDFTKMNPKFVFVNATENVTTLADTIFIQYLHLLGFDIAIFVPTGYNVIEKHLDKRLYTEHQLGEYVYNEVFNVKRRKGLFSF